MASVTTTESSTQTEEAQAQAQAQADVVRHVHVYKNMSNKELRFTRVMAAAIVGFALGSQVSWAIWPLHLAKQVCATAITTIGGGLWAHFTLPDAPPDPYYPLD